MSRIETKTYFGRMYNGRYSSKPRSKLGRGLYASSSYPQAPFELKEHAPTAPQLAILRDAERMLLTKADGGLFVTGRPGQGKSFISKQLFNLSLAHPRHEVALAGEVVNSVYKKIEELAQKFAAAQQPKDYFAESYLETEDSNRRLISGRVSAISAHSNIIDVMQHGTYTPTRRAVFNPSTMQEVLDFSENMRAKLSSVYLRDGMFSADHLIGRLGWLEHYGAIRDAEYGSPSLHFIFRNNGFGGERLSIEAHQVRHFRDPGYFIDDFNPELEAKKALPALWIDGRSGLDVGAARDAIKSMRLGGIAVIDDLLPLTPDLERGLLAFLDLCEEGQIFPVFTTNQPWGDFLNATRYAPFLSRLGRLQAYELIDRDHRSVRTEADQIDAQLMTDDALRELLLSRIITAGNP